MTTTKKVCFFDKQKKKHYFSTGGIPYEGWSQSTTMKKIEEGYRLPKPEHIDDSLYVLFPLYGMLYKSKAISIAAVVRCF